MNSTRERRVFPNSNLLRISFFKAALMRPSCTHSLQGQEAQSISQGILFKKEVPPEYFHHLDSQPSGSIPQES